MVKCSDIPDIEILQICFDRHNSAVPMPTPDEALADKYPVKVILKKMEKLEDKGFLEVGVSLCCAWLTEKGVAYLNELKQL